jgi:hypothetical protein
LVESHARRSFTHDDLTAERGSYAELFELQARAYR